MFHHGLPSKHLPPSKCIKSILFICSCVYMLRLSSLPAVRHFVSTHASLTVVLKPLNRGVRQKSSSFCSPEQEGGEGESPPSPPCTALHVAPCTSNQLSRYLERSKCQWNQWFIHSTSIYLFSAKYLSDAILSPEATMLRKRTCLCYHRAQSSLCFSRLHSRWMEIISAKLL